PFLQDRFRPQRNGGWALCRRPLAGPSACPTQGGLHCTKSSLEQVPSPTRSEVPFGNCLQTSLEAGFTTQLGLRGGRVNACMPLQIAPSPLTPSTDPRLGIGSRHQELHRCAL